MILTRRTALATGAAAATIPYAREAEATFVLGLFVGLLAYDYVRTKRENARLAMNQSAGYAAQAPARPKLRLRGATSLPDADPDQPESKLIPKLATHFGGEMEIARRVNLTIKDWGSEQLLAEKLGLWTQRIMADDPNYLMLRLHNNSDRPVHGQPEYIIKAPGQNAPEFGRSFVDDPYVIPPYETHTVEIPLKLQFDRPGYREVSLINQPPTIKAQPARIWILPFTIVEV